ncbi:MAG: sigma-70 family RNA polymerase sigma factor [Candidatus Eisenbacteria bacterium]|nr:sigma-70 family RNA polymerase sigma factor [Candidatus Eisenbacteria bacterium]
MTHDFSALDGFMEVEELHQLSDEQLARMAGGRSDAPAARHAAAVLLDRYHGRIYGWARRYVRSHEEACDLAQEAMLNVWRNLPRYESRSRFHAWVFVITRNRCLNALRKPKLLVDEDADVEVLEGAGDDPGRDLEGRLDEEELLSIIEAELDPIEQNAIYLRCFERMSVDAITAALEIQGSSGARSVLQRARQKLRQALTERGRREARSLSNNPSQESDRS